MFLHETGEDNDSFSRQDLSSMNAVSTQRPAASSTIASSSKATTQPPQPQPPPQQAPQSVSAALISMARQGSRDDAMSRSDSGDGSALPPNANWAKLPQIQQSRRSSQAASRASPSPKISKAKLPLPKEEKQTKDDQRLELTESGLQPPSQAQPEPESQSTPATVSSDEIAQVVDKRPSLVGLERAVELVIKSTFKWSLDRSLYDAETLRTIDNYPSLIDPRGGAIRHAMKLHQEEERLKEEEEKRTILQAMSATEDEDNLASGSLQLGGEPETQAEQNDHMAVLGSGRRNDHQHRPFGLPSGIAQPFDGQVSLGNDLANLALGSRSLTPQQQQQLTLLKSHTQTHDNIPEQYHRGVGGNVSHHQSQISNPFQMQNQHLNSLPGHGRQSSRYTFANDSGTAAAAVKPTTNAQLIAQQSSMMPPNHSKTFGTQAPQQQGLHTNFYSGVQGPPPGLKSSGTPPISGGGMFGQGHGFASAMGGSLGFAGSNLVGKNSNDDLMRDFLRGRAGAGNGLGLESGKREYMFPSFLQKSSTSTSSTPAPGFPSSLYGSQTGAYSGYQDHMKQQKKKGKKHRHANTSSSGGGGTVDLADPSILQARMHHGGAGQGPYGSAQGQGGYNSHNLMYGNGYGGRW